MPRKQSYITVTDQFCGAGGSSQGAQKAGAEVRLAMNHWKLAIETHNTNFQNADHVCTDISACNPRRFPSTDILISSPECTEQTDANGKKKPKKQYSLFDSPEIDPAEERSRATMWDVPRFAEYHRYNYIIVENVIQARKWIMFDAWLYAMYKLGYKHKCVYHNSMFSLPTPQSRNRMYIHFWKKGNKAPNLNFTPKAFCPKCEKDIHAVQTWKDPKVKWGVYGRNGQYVYCCPNDQTIVNPYYYAAINCIDLTDIGTRIGDRNKPLSPNTIRRIQYGKENLENWPFYIQAEHSHNTQNIRLAFEQFPTQATRQTLGIVTPDFWNNDSRNFPFIVENKGTSHSRSAFEALSAVTSVAYHGILTQDTFKSFLSYYNSGSDVSSPLTSPVGAFTGTDRVGLTTYHDADINNWYYRMIKHTEVKKGMAFADDYVILGSQKEQVLQCGNAVTPPAMEWQMQRAMETFN